MKQSGLKRKSGLKRTSSKRRRKPVSAASPAQKAKVTWIGYCICCKTTGGQMYPVDPAHLIDRSLGGCDEPDCIVPLCRRCHDRYDAHTLDLAPHLEPHFRAEVAHAIEHVGLFGALRRITGERRAA